MRFVSESTQDATRARDQLRTIITGGAPEDALRELTAAGIDWHITERGSLWIKYWQIGAEDFVPVERVAQLREGAAMHSDVSALEWVASNLVTLRNRYPGKWVAVVDAEVLASADDLPDLLRQIHDGSIKKPFLTQIPANPIVWTTAYYADQGF